MRARALTAAERKRITDNMNPADAAWFELGCDTGLRISEILSLVWRDVLEGPPTPLRTSPRVYLDKSRMKGRKRGRIVWLSDKTRVRIARIFPWHLNGNWKVAPTDKLFPISRTTAWRRIKATFKKLGISPHSMRKTFATRVYTKLKDVLLTSIVLGHQEWKNTLKYIEGMRECDLWKKVQTPRKRRPKSTPRRIGYQRPERRKKTVSSSK